MKRSSFFAMGLAILGSAVLAGRGPAGAATLPASQRLDPVRPALERTVAEAARDGLPSDLIVSKVREGLAKGAEPEAIRAAAERLARSLADAAELLRDGRPNSAGPALLRALAEARTAGVDLALAAPLLGADVADGTLVRAVDALTELALRGYPATRAASVIGEVLAREPASVGRLVASVEAIRSANGVSRLGALERFEQTLTR
jgi:hypothetical protein